jgi:regulator of sirC expression with transglutaminase-like and TPR domain
VEPGARLTNDRPVSENDFRLLVSFLTDPSANTASLVRSQIKTALINQPAFAEILPSIDDPATRREVELLNEGLWYDRLEPQFRKLFCKGPQLDLETGAFLLATIAYPTLRREQISKTLDGMATDIDRMIAQESALPTRAVRAMQRYFFELQGFKGNKDNYNDPDNSFINRVLERKTGIPISLSCVYMLVGWRLSLLIHGVGLPGHFIVGHRISRGVIHIDPFNQGRILRKKDCQVLVRDLGYQFLEEYLDPSPNDQILARMIANLINIYTEQGLAARAHWLAQLFQSIQGSSAV